MKNNGSNTSRILKEESDDALSKIRDLKFPVQSSSDDTGHIYFLFKGDEVVYVGQTTVGMNRVYHHKTKAGGCKDFDSVTMLECDVNELDKMESEWIIRLRPRYNQRFGPATVYFPKSHPSIRDHFLGWSFDHLVTNYDIRTVQLDGNKSLHYHLEDLHKAAQIAFSSRQLEIIEQSDEQSLKYFTSIPEHRRATIEQWLSKVIPLKTDDYPKLNEVDSNGTLFLQELHRLVMIQLKSDIDHGVPWVTKTNQSWLTNYFPSWSTSTLEQTLEKLSEQKLIEIVSRDGNDANDFILCYHNLKSETEAVGCGNGNFNAKY